MLPCAAMAIEKHEFLTDGWFGALAEPAVLHDPSQEELDTCVFSFEITDATADIDSVFYLLSAGQEVTVERGKRDAPNVEVRLENKLARDLLLAPSCDEFRSRMLQGEILVRGDLSKALELFNKLTNDDRGQKLVGHLKSITA